MTSTYSNASTFSSIVHPIVRPTVRLIFRLIGCLSFAFVVSLATATQQTVRQTPVVHINPPKATLYVGETQAFGAIVDGSKSAGLKWSIQEPNGGRITDEGSYTAPSAIGIYHIVASSKTDPRIKAAATVTVVEHYDAPQQE